MLRQLNYVFLLIIYFWLGHLGTTYCRPVPTVDMETHVFKKHPLANNYKTWCEVEGDEHEYIFEMNN